MEPFNEQYKQPEGHEHTEEARENECPICLEQITGTQWHCGEVVTCASGLHAFHRACAGGISNNQCPLRCGPMVGQPAHADGHGGHGVVADNAHAAPVVNNAAAAVQYHGVNIVPTGSNDVTQAVVQGATVDVQGYDYQVHGGAVNTAAANTEYDILLSNGTVLVQGVTVQANAGGGTYTFGFVWVDIPL